MAQWPPADWWKNPNAIILMTWVSCRPVGWKYRNSGISSAKMAPCKPAGWARRRDATLSETGAVTRGWVDAEDGRYYINEDGRLHTGWLDEDDHRYYLTETGVAHTGWLEWDGDRYYCKEDGEIAVGRMEIEGTTHHFASTDKQFLLVNRWNPVPAEYEPELVLYDGFQVDVSCLADLNDMAAACRADGYPFELTSAYQGVSYQTDLLQKKVNKLTAVGYTRAAAEAETGRSIAVPGTSEHHLGLAVDIKSGYNTYGWLAKNSWKYGFHF